MKSYSLLYVLSMLLIVSCATVNSVMYDYDLNVDFDSYSTYVLCSDDFMVYNENHPKIDNEAVRILIGDAVGESMESRGHKTNVFKPELQAGFRIAILEETSRFNNCEESSQLEYWETCEIYKETYSKETLIVYVADFKTNQVLWQASVPCDLNKTDDQLKLYTVELVEKLFETYPREVEIVQ